jgi:hypothetical protein
MLMRQMTSALIPKIERQCSFVRPGLKLVIKWRTQRSSAGLLPNVRPEQWRWQIERPRIETEIRQPPSILAKPKIIDLIEVPDMVRNC